MLVFQWFGIRIMTSLCKHSITKIHIYYRDIEESAAHANVRADTRKDHETVTESSAFGVHRPEFLGFTISNCAQQEVIPLH